VVAALPVNRSTGIVHPAPRRQQVAARPHRIAENRIFGDVQSTKLASQDSSGAEGKTGKNRVHLDIRVAGREVRGEHRKRLVSEHVERLVRAGATLAWQTDDVRGSSVTLRDPEGNEFCVT
jgi:hypothetical protein